MQLRLHILILFVIFTFIDANGQKGTPKNIMLEGNLLYSPTYGGGSYGILMGCRKEIVKNRTSWLAVDAGIQEDFQIFRQNFKEFRNNNGYVLKNALDVTLGPSVYLLKSRKLNLGLDIFGGWTYKKINGKVDDDILDIHRSYSTSRHFFSRGLFFHTGYKFSEDLAFQFIFKIDLTVLSNSDGIIEAPDYIFGIGVCKRF